MMRGDVLPPKRQAVVDRLRRRIELYRRHHNATLPRYEAAANAIYEEQHQDTLMLKQRYLESKTKKAKKNEHKTVKDNSGNAGSSNAAATEAQKNLLGKFNKQTPSENMEPSLESSSGGDGHLEKDQRSCKASRSCTSTPEQQIQESGSMQSQQLQSIPSFDCIKSGLLQSGNQTRRSSSTPKSPANISMGNIKLENDVDTTLCGGNTNGVPGTRSQDCGASSKQAETASSGEQFPDSFPNLGFPEDSSEVWVDNPEILRHLIDDITNPSDLMTDFNFSYGVETLKEGSNEKDNNGAIMGQGEKKRQDVSSSFGQSNPFPSHSHASQTSGSGFESRIPNPVDVMTRTTGGLSPNFPGNMQPPGQYSSQDLGGLEFKLSEPSLAAQTLKQMAEQHQQHKNSRAKHTMSMPSLKRSFADTYETNVGPMRTSVFDPASNQMPKQLSTSSVTYNSMNYPAQSAVQSTFHVDSTSKQPMNILGTQGFNKLEANMYGVGREQQQACQTNKPLMRMPSTELQVACGTKMGQYSSSAEEKAAFFSNFKASLAQFNESSASPPLTKSPSQFNKRMTPSPLSQQGQMMVGHRQVQGNQRPQKDHKEIAPLNISSNPSYAEALAFSSTAHTPPTSHFQHHPIQHKAQQSKTVSFSYNELQTRTTSTFSTSTTSMSDVQQHTRNMQNRPPMTITSQPFQNFGKINVGAVQRHPHNIMHSISPAAMQQTQQPFVSQTHVPSSTKANIVSFVSQPSSSAQFATNQANFSLPNIATIRSGMFHATSTSSTSRGNQMFPQHKLLYTSAAPRPQRLPVNVEWRQTMAQQPCFQQQRAQGVRMNQQFLQQPVQRVQVPQQRPQFQASTLQSMSQPLPQLQIPQRTIVQSGGTFSPSLTSNISDFSLEFLDSIENSDSDLLNFDPVNSNFGILDDVLGGK